MVQMPKLETLKYESSQRRFSLIRHHHRQQKQNNRDHCGSNKRALMEEGNKEEQNGENIFFDILSEKNVNIQNMKGTQNT